MTKIRVATFNVENLFARYKFRSNVDPERAIQHGFFRDQTRFDLKDEDAKEITGAAINDLNADVLCLQEVENLDTLKRFRSGFLGGRRAYPYVALVDGNDPRGIDVAVLSRRPIVHIRTWQHLKKGARTVFSRDCLEVDIDTPDGKGLTIYNNHFKSMIKPRNAPANVSGRAATKAKRQRQCEAVREIIRDRFGPRTGQPLRNRFVILGDFNDTREPGSGITALTEWREIQDLVLRLPSDERWTHYWNGGNKYSQLDYLMVSDSLARAHLGVEPVIWRFGLPERAERYEGARYDGVGRNKPKASDHCPVSFDFDL